MNRLLQNIFGRKRNLVILIVMIAIPLTVPLVSAQENNVTPATTSDKGLQFIGAALAIGLSGIGAGIAIYGATSAGAAAIVEKPELTTWILIFAALGEGLAIYGLVISILILGA